MSIRVLEPGAFTTVQDLGRPGWGWCGVPPSGAFDVFACRAANLLVGNDVAAAVLESTMTGPILTFEATTLVVITGAESESAVDGNPVEAGTSFVVEGGATLRVGAARSGLRCYVAFGGGIDVPSVLGSRSTYVASELGGIEGRALRGGDTFAIASPPAEWTLRRRSLVPGTLPRPGGETTLRVVAGAHASRFTPDAMRRLLSEPYRVSPRSDRVGVRLEGPALERADATDVDPEGVVTGDVQVPGDGSPIVLGPDRPATGGYPKMATVIAADLPLLAHVRPGGIVRFAGVSVEVAREAYRRREAAEVAGVVETR